MLKGDSNEPLATYRCGVESSRVVARNICHDLGELVLTAAAKRFHQNPPGVFALGFVDKDIGADNPLNCAGVRPPTRWVSCVKILKRPHLARDTR